MSAAADPEPIEQRLHVGITVKVDVRIRMNVACQELLDTECPGAMSRADEDRIAESACDQLHPAKDERAHQDLADLGVGLHDRKQAFTIQLAHFARFAHLRPQQGTAAGEHVHFARKLAGTMHCHEFFARSRWANDLDLARDDEEKGAAGSPASNRTSPRRVDRRCPCATTRATCAGVSLGNIRSAGDFPLNGICGVRVDI